MARMRGAEALVACLKAIETRRVYGLIGTSIVGFLDGLYDARQKIHYISCRHEQVAASMADAEGRLTRRPGVVALHSGPGALNAMISLANAAKDCSPIVAICGTIKRRLQGCDGMLELDHVRVFRPLCRGTFRVESTRDIPAVFSQAYRAAMSGPGGPALIEVPEDLWNDRDEVDLGQLDLAIESPPPVDAVQLESIARRLTSAGRPLILAGAGVSYSHAEDLLVRLAEGWQIPVATTGNGRGALSELHTLSFGRAGYGGGCPVADAALEQADYVLAIGCTISDMTTYEYTAPIRAEITVVNLDHDNELKKIPLEAVYADANEFLGRLLQRLGNAPQGRSAWTAELQPQRTMWRNLIDGARRAVRTPPSPAHVCDLLAQLLADDAIVTVGAGMHLLYAMDFIPCRRPLTYLSAVNFGAMGFGLAAALGAKLVYPERHVVSVIGDGDFLMTVQDLETAVRERIAAKIFVINDNAYRVLAFRQRAQFAGRVYGSQHGNPDLLRLADSFGMKAWRLQSPDNLRETLETVLAEPGPALVEVLADPDDIPPTNLVAAMRMN